MENQTSTCQCPHSNRFISLAVILFVAIVGGGVGAFANSYFNKSVNSNLPQTITYKMDSGIDVSLKQKDATPTSNLPVIPDDIRMLSGAVTSIKGGQITLDTRSMNLRLDSSFDFRTATVGPATKIFKLTEKDAKTIQSESLNTSTSSRAKPSTFDPLADMFIYTPVAISGIVAGDMIAVTATENIKTKKEFSAERIEVMPKVVTVTIR